MLHFGALKGNLDLVKKLCIHGININILNRFNQTSLHIASVRGFYDIVEFLVLNGIDVNVLDDHFLLCFPIDQH